MKTPRYQWTAARINTLMSGREKNIPFRVIATNLDAPESSCREKYKRLRSGSDAMPQIIEKVDRVCSMCGDPFTAEGRFFRVCDPCKASSSWRSSCTDFSMVV